MAAAAAVLIPAGMAVNAQDVAEISELPGEPLADEPVGFVAHGGIYDRNGNEIEPDVAQLARIVNYYSGELDRVMTEEERSAHAALRQEAESRWREIVEADTLLTADRQALLLQAYLLDDRLDRFNPADGGRLRGISTFVKRAAAAPISDIPVQERAAVIAQSRFFNLLEDMFAQPAPGDVVLFSTQLSGQAYIDECENADVPIPPDWGDAAWESTGELSDAEEFISRGLIARPHIYRSAAPVGACIALPRVDDQGTPAEGDDMIILLGIICVGKETGNACFWDNQEAASDGPEGFSIPVGDPLPLSQFMGGAGLFGGSGGRCSHCHAGENPYVIHPGTALGPPDINAGGSDLERMPELFYSPLVHPDWYQNKRTSAIIDEPEASTCSSCHSGPANGSLATTDAGRLPMLVPEISGGEYCAAVLKNAINIAPTDPQNTMPFGSQLSANAHSDLVALIDDFCAGGNDIGKDAGDPHLTTIDQVRYDFQAAGEFVLLENYAGFEVQARQSPIPTSFFPGPNAHTGVASCVSINTAVAARVGDTRVTWQPGLDGVARPEGLELRIDGRLTQLTEEGVALPGGGVVRRSAADGLEIEFPNGEYLSAVPGYWASQGHWMLNIAMSDLEARRGIMGSIPADSWLPRLPDGTSVGPRPADEASRYHVLNDIFANAWRVNALNSLFDYAPGQGPSDFELAGWPKDSPDCEVPGRTAPPPATPAEAQAACAAIIDPGDRANCEFDFELTGAQVFPDVYEREQRVLRLGTETEIILVSGRGRPARERLYAVNVKPRWNGLMRQPEGSVELSAGGSVIGQARPVDAAGLAYFEGREIADLDSPVIARFIPDGPHAYLPSASGPVVLTERFGATGGDGQAGDPFGKISKRELLYLIIALLILILLLVVITLIRQRR